MAPCARKQNRGYTERLRRINVYVAFFAPVRWVHRKAPGGDHIWPEEAPSAIPAINSSRLGGMRAGATNQPARASPPRFRHGRDETADSCWCAHTLFQVFSVPVPRVIRCSADRPVASRRPLFFSTTKSDEIPSSSNARFRQILLSELPTLDTCEYVRRFRF